jgi:hypothetical protein
MLAHKNLVAALPRWGNLCPNLTCKTDPVNADRIRLKEKRK